MKKFSLITIAILVSFLASLAQVPTAFNYQAVVRNTAGELIADQDVSLRISILQDSENGTSVYSESHAIHTNSFGLANLKIGKGTVLSGVFSPGGWGVAPHFIKIEIDPEGGTSYLHVGTSQLLSVPYAFHAQTVEVDNVDDADADPNNEIQALQLSGTQLSLSKGGGTVTLPSSGGGDNWGTQTVVSDGTLTGNGTSASPLSVVGDLADNQTLSISGSDLSISGGNTVSLPNLWTASSSDIYFNKGKVFIGRSPDGSGTQLYVDASTNNHAIAAESQSVVATIYAKNRGTGPAGDFRNYLRILDGTQGAGKVLTSDANGLTSWQTPASGTSLWTKSGDHIVYSMGNVAIGNLVAPVDGIKLRVEAAEPTQIAVRAANNSTSYAALYAINSGSGPAALFASPIIIKDGTEGNGKVLTADANGLASWQTPLQPLAYGTIKSDGTIFYTSGNITVTNPSTGRYEVTISGISYDYREHTCNITLSGIVGFARASSSSNKLVVLTYDKAGTAADTSFNFIVF